MNIRIVIAALATLFVAHVTPASATESSGCGAYVFSNSPAAVSAGKAVPASESLYWYMDDARAERAGIWSCQPITAPFDDVAKAANISPSILAAVALNETSRNGKPWPWTLDVAGHPFFFHSRDEAYRAASYLLAHHFVWFDIGIMQVNWKYNGWRFKNVWQALQPSINMSAAANILNTNFDKTHSWARAVELYHSANRYLGRTYLADFLRHLQVVAER